MHRNFFKRIRTWEIESFLVSLHPTFSETTSESICSNEKQRVDFDFLVCNTDKDFTSCIPIISLDTPQILKITILSFVNVNFFKPLHKPKILIGLAAMSYGCVMIIQFYTLLCHLDMRHKIPKDRYNIHTSHLTNIFSVLSIAQ